MSIVKKKFMHSNTSPCPEQPPEIKVDTKEIISKIERTGKKLNEVVERGSFAENKITLNLNNQTPVVIMSIYDQDLELEHETGGWARPTLEEPSSTKS